MNIKRCLQITLLLLVTLGINGIFAQKKNPSRTKTEKPYVNPVKLTKEERARPYMDEVLKSHDELTPEEAERRRKNIEAGNPFKKYGYYPKVATLSKGKYLEFHDMDSIVSIGSIRYNKKTKDIVEFREIHLSNPDAQPYLDTAGRWFSPDPLSKEFSNWSPYNFVFNNPISNVDPDGRAPLTDYKLLQNGEVQRLNALDGSEKRKDDRLFTTDASGKVTSQSNVFTVDKKSAGEVSIIGQLSQTNDGKLSDSFGMALNPFFSEGFSKNLDTAFNLYNFLDNNTNTGIEFSLAQYSDKSGDYFQIATKHALNTSDIKSNRFSNDNLVWSAHNHDGKIGLDYMNVGNQWAQDKVTMNSIFRNNASKGLGFPRFFTVNDNNRMIEITGAGQNTSKTYPFNVQFLKSLQRVYGK
ncbi:JAB-like toxin 1 domain-containing protein [Chryseobacterium gambrini]|uniref:RHS repeat-associated core domain-containing protein n=1 Tax=Chryseobacterium gambrini TaxID=373672 RepID=A0ABM8KA94_9FLAO|nr:hypothetical protein CRDW_33380 [Chryseobacterium gambrini]